jgi:poly(A) polymerase
MAPRILPRPEHTVSRKAIDADALKVLYRLKNHGFVAYLVGGGVRDLLLGRQPKDFDIGTSAHPQQVKKLFRNCFIIGRRFRLAHVRFGKKVVEVSTFRRQAESEGGDTLIRRDNTFGTPEEDAFRRDFTVNALFYDIATFSVIDYVGGLDDLKRKTIRTIGDPAVRFREDPVRMLRAVAFAARLGFEIQRDTLEAIRTLRGELVKSSPARLLDEVFKILRQGASAETFRLLHETGILIYLMPQAGERIAAGSSELLRSLARLDAFRNTGGDAGADLTNPILLGTLFGPLGMAPRPVGRRHRDAEGASDRETDDVPAEMAALGVADEDALEPAPPSSMPIGLPFARRDMDRLRLILAAQKRLADLRTSPRARGALAGRAYLKEALMWLEIHGGEAGRDLARLWQEPVASALAPEEGEPPAPPPPRRRPRRRRRRTRVPGPPAEPGA